MHIIMEKEGEWKGFFFLTHFILRNFNAISLLVSINDMQKLVEVYTLA